MRAFNRASAFILAAGLATAVGLPQALETGTLSLVSEVLLALAMAQMWNLLAGYTGLLSFGQQAFVGLGAYMLFESSQRLGISPLLMLPVAALFGALVAALIAPALFRLRDAYFSVALWVFAEVMYLLISGTDWLGSTAGRPLDTSHIGDIERFQLQAFWVACTIGFGTVAGVLALMRSRLGLALLTVRDNELAALSIGVDAWRVRFPAFVLAGAVCALAGAAHYMSSMFVAPAAAFDVNWVVMMLFATLIGGIGTIEGPIIGIVVWFLLREALIAAFDLSGGWTLIVMGAVAVAVALWAPKGLWGLACQRLGWRGLSVRRQPRAAAAAAATAAAAAAPAVSTAPTAPGAPPR